MSLRDEFEKLCGDDFDLRTGSDGVTYVNEHTRRVLRFYQSATERALRIVREEQEADYDDHRNRVKAIERRLKGDS